MISLNPADGGVDDIHNQPENEEDDEDGDADDEEVDDPAVLTAEHAVMGLKLGDMAVVVLGLLTEGGAEIVHIGIGALGRGKRFLDRGTYCTAASMRLRSWAVGSVAPVRVR